jgi:hypothetical protein
VGWKLLGDIQVGDEVTSSLGSASLVTGVYPQGFKQIVEVTFSDGATVECCEEHLWRVRSSTSGKETWTILSTTQLSDCLSLSCSCDSLLEIPLVSPVMYQPSTLPLPMDPYIFGFLLGSLSALCRGISPLSMMEVGSAQGLKLDISCWKDLNGLMRSKDNSSPSINSRDLWAAAVIPERYLRASLCSRLDLLRGVFDSSVSLWDSDRDTDKQPQLRIHSPSKVYTKGMIELVQSLGGIVLRQQSDELILTGEEELLIIRISVNPFSLPSKMALFDKYSNHFLPQRYVVSIAKIRQDRAVCISVSAPDHLYVTDHFVVTHNTIQAIASTAMYIAEWPVLVFTPSSARYHWKVVSSRAPPPPSLSLPTPLRQRFSNGSLLRY